MSVPFTPADNEILAAQLQRFGPFYCRGCVRCTGTCRFGLPVPDLVRFAMYADGYGEYRLGREAFLTLPAEARAPRCAECRECTVRCPNGLRVAERTRRAQELFG
jgi:predicted aldo/keto reductase-like oxidoreductase